MLRLLGDRGRKQGGNALSIWLAHPRAALSQEKFRIRRYKVPARERIQSPGATAGMFARATNCRIRDVSSLPRSSHSLAMLGFTGAGGQYGRGRDPWSAVGVTGKREGHCVSGWRAVRVQRASSAAHRSRQRRRPDDPPLGLATIAAPPELIKVGLPPDRARRRVCIENTTAYGIATAVREDCSLSFPHSYAQTFRSPHRCQFVAPPSA